MRLLLHVLCGLAVGLGAAESTAETINTRIATFESGMDRAFVPVQRQLEQWRERHVRGARRTLQDLLKKAAPEDQVFLAYHLLADDPRYRPAREVFTKIGITPPFAEDGTPAADWTTPTCTNRALVAQVAALAYPPFEAVAEAIGMRNSAASSYWRKLGKELADLKSDLIAIAVAKQAEKAADTIYPMLAYYHREAKEVAVYYKATNQQIPRQRVWFNPVDRWLLDNELAGIDCLQGPDGKPISGTNLSGRAYPFPEPLRGARIELVGTVRSGVRLRLDNGGNAGAEAMITGKEVVLRDLSARDPLATIPLDVDLSTDPVPFQFELRGRTLTVRLGGVVAGTATLAKPVALRRFELAGSVSAQSLRVRYLADLPEMALLGEPGTTPPPAAPTAPPAWQAERTTQLARSVTVAFNDTTLDEVAAMLGVLTGATFTIDASADPLKDLPVTMTAQDLALGNVLEWLQRLTDVAAEPTETGFMLVWKP